MTGPIAKTTAQRASALGLFALLGAPVLAQPAEPPAQAAHRLGLAEGPLAGGEVVEHHAQREQVAARIVAHELHLLGPHVGPGAHRQRELLVEQVGQVQLAQLGEDGLGHAADI